MAETVDLLEIILPHNCFVCEKVEAQNLNTDYTREYQQLYQADILVANSKDIRNIDQLLICPNCRNYFHRNCWKIEFKPLQKVADTCPGCSRHIPIKSDNSRSWGLEATLMRVVLSISSMLGLIASIVFPAMAFTTTPTYYDLAIKYHLPLIPNEIKNEPPINSAEDYESLPDSSLQTTPEPSPQTEEKSDIEIKQAEIRQALVKWSEIKPSAYLNKDTTQLSSILINPALDIRIEGIAYWQESSSRQYTNLVIQSMDINNIVFQDNDLAIATVHVKESHSTSEGDKDVEGDFDYTLKKIGSQWYISDIKQVS